MDGRRDRETLARRVLDTVPLIVRSLHRDLRSTPQRVEPNHFHILGLLAERPHSMSELASRLMVSLPSMSKTVQTLVERQWVERMPAAADRRVVLVKLTLTGGDALRGTRVAMLASVTAVLAPLTHIECENLSAGLDVLFLAFGGAGGLDTCVGETPLPH